MMKLILIKPQCLLKSFILSPGILLRQFSGVILDPIKSDIENKYAEKIKRKAIEKGLTVNALKEKAKQEYDLKQSQSLRDFATSGNSNHLPASTISTNATKRPAKSKSASSTKQLSDIVQLELLEKETAQNIENIWNQYHASKEGFFSGAMTSSFYKNMMDMGKKYPLFLLPLPRNQGVEFYIFQFSGAQIYFTSLLEYKTHSVHAKPHLVLTHYSDFAETKNLVLMAGELDMIRVPGEMRPTCLDAAEARMLIYMMQLFYGSPIKNLDMNRVDETGESNKLIDIKRRLEMVKMFHENPKDFDYQALIKEIEILQ